MGNNRTASSIEQATGDSVTMSWEAASTGVWAIAAVPINPVVPPEPTDIAGATIAPIPDQTYTGSALTPAVTVTLGSDTLVEDTDYTVAYEDNTNAGTATVTLTGIGDYTGTKSASFTIAKATPSVTAWPSASSITLGQALSASTLTGGTHSVPGTFTFVDPTTVPLATGPYTAAVTFTPTDSANYNSVGGTIEVQVNEAPADIAGAIVYPIPDQTYNGSAITPAVTVELGAVALVKDTDYTVAYASNTNAGTATVTLTGIGDYTGTKNANFTIAKATPILTWPSASAITLGQALSASTLIGGTHSVPGAFAFVDPGRVPLVAGSHLATVIFVPTDTANYYSVSETVQVQVNPAPVAPISLSSATVARISNRTYTGSAIKPSVTVTVGGRDPCRGHRLQGRLREEHLRGRRDGDHHRHRALRRHQGRDVQDRAEEVGHLQAQGGKPEGHGELEEALGSERLPSRLLEEQDQGLQVRIQDLEVDQDRLQAQARRALLRQGPRLQDHRRYALLREVEHDQEREGEVGDTRAPDHVPSARAGRGEGSSDD